MAKRGTRQPRPGGDPLPDESSSAGSRIWLDCVAQRALPVDHEGQVNKREVANSDVCRGGPGSGVFARAAAVFRATTGGIPVPDPAGAAVQQGQLGSHQF